MLTKNEIALVYETLLSSPGMEDKVKIDLRMPRRNVLLLAKVIEKGLAGQGEKEEGSVLSIVDAAALAELKGIAADILEKGGFSTMNDRLNSLSIK